MLIRVFSARAAWWVVVGVVSIQVSPRSRMKSVTHISSLQHPYCMKRGGGGGGGGEGGGGQTRRSPDLNVLNYSKMSK